MSRDKTDSKYRTESMGIYIPYMETNDPKQLCEGSSTIAEIKVTGFIDHQYFQDQCKKCQIEIIKVYKGEMADNSAIFLYNDNFEAGGTYLVLIEPTNNTLFYPSSKYSCIPISDTETYNEFMQYIQP